MQIFFVDFFCCCCSIYLIAFRLYRLLFLKIFYYHLTINFLFILYFIARFTSNFHTVNCYLCKKNMIVSAAIGLVFDIFFVVLLLWLWKYAVPCSQILAGSRRIFLKAVLCSGKLKSLLRALGITGSMHIILHNIFIAGYWNIFRSCLTRCQQDFKYEYVLFCFVFNFYSLTTVCIQCTL